MLTTILLQASKLPFAGTEDNLSFLDVANRLIAYAILAAFALSVIYVFYGGFKFIFSGGDDGKVKQATNTIRHAIIGLIITLLATFIVSLVGKLFGLDVIGTLINSNDIMNNLAIVISRLSGEGSAIK